MAKLTKKSITKTLLEAAAADLNNAIVLDEPIPITGKFKVVIDGNEVEKDVTKATLEKDVIDVGGMLNADEAAKLTPATVELLTFYKVELPKADAVEETKAEQLGAEPENVVENVSEANGEAPGTIETEKEGVSKKGKKKVSKKKTKATPKKDKADVQKYTRSHALVDAFKMGGGTKQEMIKNADELYVKNGNGGNLNVSEALLRYVMPTLLILGVVSETEKGVYQLNE